VGLAGGGREGNGSHRCPFRAEGVYCFFGAANKDVHLQEESLIRAQKGADSFVPGSQDLRGANALKNYPELLPGAGPGKTATVLKPGNPAGRAVLSEGWRGGAGIRYADRSAYRAGAEGMADNALPNAAVPNTPAWAAMPWFPDSIAAFIFRPPFP